MNPCHECLPKGPVFLFRLWLHVRGGSTARSQESHHERDFLLESYIDNYSCITSDVYFSYWYTQCVCTYIYIYMHIIGQPLWNGGWPLTNDYRIRIRSRQWWWMMNSGLLLENEVIFPHHWWLPSWSNWLFYPSTDHQIWSVESVSEMFGAKTCWSRV